MKELEQLTYLQKTALEGELSFALSSCRHNAEVLYRVYTVLKDSPLQFRPFILDTLKETTKIPSECISKILIELELDSVPLWIWVDRCIGDLKESLSIADQQSLGFDDLFIDKREAKRKVIKSAFTMFCRKVATVSVKGLKSLCNRVLSDNHLDFLHMTCFSLLDEVTFMKEDTKIKPEIMAVAFDIREILSFTFEKNNMDKIFGTPLNVIPKKRGRKKKEVTEEVTDEIKNKIKNELDQILKVEKKVSEPVFKVLKTFKGSKVTTTLRTFKTKEEAIQFIDDIKKQFPEVLETCTFTLVAEKKVNGYG